MKEKKRNDVDKYGNFWKTFRSKGDHVEEKTDGDAEKELEVDFGEDDLNDADIEVYQDLVDIVDSASAGPSSG